MTRRELKQTSFSSSPGRVSMEFPFNSLVFGASVVENCFLIPRHAFESTSKNPTLVPVLLSAIVCTILCLPALVLSEDGLQC